MSVHRYPVRAMWPDYARCAAGLALSIGPLAALEVVGWVVYVLSALGILCAVHLGQTLAKHRTVIEIDDGGLSVSPGGRRFDWSALRDVTMSYFSVRKDGEDGWMELRIDVPGSSLRVDSRLDGFARLTARVVGAARDEGLELNETTELNLAVLAASSRARMER